MAKKGPTNWVGIGCLIYLAISAFVGICYIDNPLSGYCQNIVDTVSGWLSAWNRPSAAPYTETPRWLTIAAFISVAVCDIIAYILYFRYKKSQENEYEWISDASMLVKQFKVAADGTIQRKPLFLATISAKMAIPLVIAGILEIAWCLYVGIGNIDSACQAVVPTVADNGYIITWGFNILYYSCLGAQALLIVQLFKRWGGFRMWSCGIISSIGLLAILIWAAPYVFWLFPLMLIYLNMILPETRDERIERERMEAAERKRREEEDRAIANGEIPIIEKTFFRNSRGMLCERRKYANGRVMVLQRDDIDEDDYPSQRRDEDDRKPRNDSRRPAGPIDYKAMYRYERLSNNDCSWWSDCNGCTCGSDRKGCSYEYSQSDCPHFSPSYNFKRRVEQRVRRENTPI